MPAPHSLKHILWWTAGLLAIGLITAATFVVQDYQKLARVVDDQLARGPYARTVNFYAAPETIAVGDRFSQQDVVSSLQRANFRASAVNTAKSFQVEGDAIEIHPAAPADPMVVRFSGSTVASISDLTTDKELDSFVTDPPLVDNLSHAGRERRLILHFADLPPVLVNAITSAEDKHFFQHGGYDPFRVAKAMYVDARDRRKEQGASTISMQLARNLYLNPEKRWQRKWTEFLITYHLERALTKQQIFEYYCNQVYLGGYGTFSINGFGEAARAYFNEDTQKLTLPQAAMLAGLIQRPSYFNPFRNPERARERRNIVLRMMHNNGYIDDAQLAEASSAPLGLAPGTSEVSQNQYAMDLANGEFEKDFEGQEFSGITNVYTTIDLRLQDAAELAVAEGMKSVDKLLAGHRDKNGNLVRAQAALIALDPHTGEIKAVVGGRDYSVSQLDRVEANRPPGSVFKPFVYAAALSTAADGSSQIYTPSSTVADIPTVFHYDGQTYKPGNFKNEYHGTVTFRQALAKSMNVAAVGVGQMVGFEQVVELAERAGLGSNLRATPAVALGSYDATPYEIARAYTLFANDGVLVEPRAVSMIADDTGASVFRTTPETRRILDPRVNFLLVDMMQDVLRYGTAAGVRSRGFTLPAAGKTGTSHDGWFSGFTSQLLCVVWVGFDDYSELNLEGAHSALPIWTAFMQAAAHSKYYGSAEAFLVPDGVVRASVDPSTGKLATPFCPSVTSDFFLDGTQPTEACFLHENGAIPALSTAPETSAIQISTALPNLAPPTPIAATAQKTAEKP